MSKTVKVGCVFMMVVVSLLPLAEIGRNDHREMQAAHMGGFKFYHRKSTLVAIYRCDF